jgi:hypothetical protein
MLFAYFGPETMLPVASVITGIVGVVLMFWRGIIQVVRNAFRFVWPASPPKIEKPAMADQKGGDMQDVSPDPSAPRSGFPSA